MQTALQSAANQVWVGLSGIADVTQFGLEVREQIDLDDFRKAFGLLLFLDSRYKVFINFALGDLYNALDLRHGEKKAQITDTWGHGWYQRLSKLGNIARRIPKSRRHDFKLEWHVYESFSLRSIPDDVRDSGLEAAAKMKANGQYVTRETLRHSVDPYRQPKEPKAAPQWNNGEGGGFGDAADRAEQEPPQAPKEPEEPGAQTEYPKTQCPECGEWIEDIDGFGVLAHEACGYCSHPSRDGGVCGICGDTKPEPSPHTTYLPPEDPRDEGVFSAPWWKEQAEKAEAEVERLQCAMASWADNHSYKGPVLEIPYDLEEMIKLELVYRKDKEPGDATLDFQSVGLLALRRGLKTLAADHGRKR